MNLNKIIRYMVGLGILVFGIVFGQSISAEEEGHEEEDEGIVRISPEEIKEFGIVLAKAEPGELKVYVSLPGEVVVNPDRFAHMIPRMSGVVRKVHKNLGDRVQEGEIMAVIESRELSDLKASLLAAKERIELLATAFTREEKLWKGSISSEREYLEAKQALAEARIELRSAQYKLYALGFSEQDLSAFSTRANASFTEYEILAPLDGSVVEKNITRGEAIKDDADIFSVADLNTVWVNLTVYQKDLPNIRIGQEVRIVAQEGFETAVGSLSYISPIIDEENRTATARLELPNSEGHWRPGLFVTGKIVVRSLFVAILVPKTAIQTLEGKSVVFVQGEEGFEPHVVKVGSVNETHAEVISGLQPGQTYAAVGAFTLKAQLTKSAFEEDED